MNLLCPNCQKMLTVPEEFAGQLMKCPLCGGTFTVPGLPGTGSPPSAAPEEPEPEIYSVRAEPQPASPPPPLTPAVPDLELSPPPSPPPSSTATTTAPLPSAPAPSLSPLPPEGYRRTLSASLNPRVLPWVAPVCLLLIFFLQFCNWLGLYPGGVPAATQNAWQAAFGFHTVDPDVEKDVPALTDKEFKIGVSVLTIFYLLLFFPVLIVSVASVVLPMLQIKLPPVVAKLMPWSWAIVAAINLVLFFFLLLQVLLGFSLDSRYSDWVDKQVKGDSSQSKNTVEKKHEEVVRGEQLAMLDRTSWLRLTVLLHLIAVVCAALMFWVSQRGSTRPLPKLELMW